MAQPSPIIAQIKILAFLGKYLALHRFSCGSRGRFQMVRLSLAVALLVGTMGTAQPSIPRLASPDATAPSDLDQTYLVFFEDGKASLTPQARQILQVAARRAHTMGQVKVHVILSMASDGTAALLKGRARVVRAELVRDG